jgi:hypothetical protein
MDYRLKKKTTPIKEWSKVREETPKKGDTGYKLPVPFII